MEQEPHSLGMMLWTREAPAALDILVFGISKPLEGSIPHYGKFSGRKEPISAWKGTEQPLRWYLIVFIPFLHPLLKSGGFFFPQIGSKRKRIDPRLGFLYFKYLGCVSL